MTYRKDQAEIAQWRKAHILAWALTEGGMDSPVPTLPTKPTRCLRATWGCSTPCGQPSKRQSRKGEAGTIRLAFDFSSYEERQLSVLRRYSLSPSTWTSLSDDWKLKLLKAEQDREERVADLLKWLKSTDKDGKAVLPPEAAVIKALMEL